MEKFIRNNTHFSNSRLNSLYSNFENLSQLNPEGFEANIQAWSNLLISLIQSENTQGSKLSIGSRNPNIAQILALPVLGQPKGLGIVLDELVDRKVLIPYSWYKNSTHSVIAQMSHQDSLVHYFQPSKWLQWGVHMLGLGKFRSRNTSGNLIDERYISWSTLCEIGNFYLQAIRKTINNGTRSSGLFDKTTLHDFIKKNIDPNLSTIDFEILLLYFSRDIEACTTRVYEGVTYIKFEDVEATDGLINEEDIGIVNLKSTIVKLENRNEELGAKILSISEMMKQMIQSKNIINEKQINVRLRNMLLTKRVFLTSLEKTSNALNQLTTTLLKINDATSNKFIFDLLSQSSMVLKTLNDSIDIGKVDDLQIELQENYDQTELISDALASGVNSTNDEELDAELNQLYEQEVTKPSSDTERANFKNNDSDLTERLRKMNVNEEPEKEVPKLEPA